MPIITCDCTGNGTFCRVCKLNVVGYVTGWLGIVSKTVFHNNTEWGIRMFHNITDKVYI